MSKIKKESLRIRNEKITKEFEALVSKQRLQVEYACEKLGEKFYLAPNTIYAIVKKIGKYSNKIQT